MAKFSLIGASFLIITYSACAQKLPNIQEQSLRLPAGYKIDGKAIEWNNEFKAYNKNTNFYYSMANDDDDLYLIIQIIDPVIVDKTVSAGITFTVYKPGKKDEENAASITYPVFDVRDRPQVDVKNTPKIDPNSPVSLLKADSFMNDNNRRLIDKSKWIRVNGMKDLDTLVSVYNRDGIKIKELFDNKMTYTFELLIDLKHLGLSVKNSETFTYNIRSNGAKVAQLNGVSYVLLPPGGPFAYRLSVGRNAMPPTSLKITGSTTDLRGEYTLAKK